MKMKTLFDNSLFEEFMGQALEKFELHLKNEGIKQNPLSCWGVGIGRVSGQKDGFKSGSCPRIAPQCSWGTRCSFLCNGSKRRRSPADPAVRPALGTRCIPGATGNPGAHAVSPALAVQA